MWNDCEDKGIIVTSITPHTFCRLQPLSCSLKCENMMEFGSTSWPHCSTKPIWKSPKCKIYPTSQLQICPLNQEIATEIFFEANRKPKCRTIYLKKATMQLHLWQHKSAHKMWYRLNYSPVLPVISMWRNYFRYDDLRLRQV